MNPTVIKISVGIVCTAIALIYNLWKTYKDVQEFQKAREMEEASRFQEDSVSVCCICLTEFDGFQGTVDLFSLPCKHRFHRNCIMTLFYTENGHRSCPLCRRVISEEFIVQHFGF